jgi:hypothetical protein
MDELIQHCVRELSFDGDFGCNVSRLRDFVVGYYAENPTAHPQRVDDDFYAFVWSLVVQQPTVRVGVLPEGAAIEVYIAPQISAVRKAKANGEGSEPIHMPSLHVIRDANSRPLDDLNRHYGDTLRIAVDPEKSFEAITGSHVRVCCSKFLGIHSSN